VEHYHHYKYNDSDCKYYNVDFTKVSLEELKKYKVDSPKELSFIGSSLVRLGSAISGCLVLSEHEQWAIGSMVITWFGHEMNEYFKIHEEDKKNDNLPS
jgi:hypothetical protein